MPLDPYEQLGVARDATREQITKAYRSKVRAAHPDRNPNDPYAATRTAQINEAYEILSSRERRLAFDTGNPDEHQTLLSGARAMICERFKTCLNSKTPSPSGGLIIRDVRSALLAELRGLKAAKAEGKRCNESLNGMRKRFRRRIDGGSDFLNETLDEMIAHNNRELEQAERGIKVFTLAVKLIDDFEDVTDDEPVRRVLLLDGSGSSVTGW